MKGDFIMKSALVIAEKKTVADDIGLAYSKIKERYSLELDIFHAEGHIVELSEPEDYDASLKEWKLESLPIIPEKFTKKIINTTLYNKIKDAVNNKSYNYIINACDNDREGQLVFYLIYEMLKIKIPVLRMWFDDTSEETIIDALDNLTEDLNNKNLTKAAYLRLYSDWLIGINFSRASSIALGRTTYISRVATPTLKMIVNREKEVLSFRKENYAEVTVLFTTENGEKVSAKLFNPYSDSRSYYAYKDVEKIKELCSELPSTGTVINYSSKETHIKPPHFFNQTDLQRACSKLGLAPWETMQIAQSLYEKKLITYPRTESKHISRAMSVKIPDILSTLSGLDSLTESFKGYNEIIMLNSLRDKKWVNDKKVIHHPALIPTTTVPNYDELSSNEILVYELIAKSLLSICFEDSVVVESEATVRIIKNDEELIFRATNSKTTFPGWKTVYGTNLEDLKDVECDSLLPKLNEGDILYTTEVKLTHKETKPTPRYSFSTLLRDMEQAGKVFELDKEDSDTLSKSSGLGTVATRAEIIHKLIENGYIEYQLKENEHEIIPTEEGITLIDMLGSHTITSAELTARWEGRLERVESGELSYNDYFSQLKDYVQNEIIPLESLENIGPVDKIVCKCPVCNSDVYEGKKFYYCKNAVMDKDNASLCSLFLPKKFGRSTLHKNDIKSICENGGKERLIETATGKKVTVFLKLGNDMRLQFGEKPSVGECPKCQGRVYVGNKVYYCENFTPNNTDSKCDFYVSKTFGKTNITREMFKEILKNGRTKNEYKISFDSGKSFTAPISIKEHSYSLIAYKSEPICRCSLCAEGIIYDYKNMFSCNNCNVRIAKKFLSSTIDKTDMLDLMQGKHIKKQITFKTGQVATKDLRMVVADNGDCRLEF